MKDDIHNKVIDIFQRHRHGDHFHFETEEGGELVISPDGFNYVSFKDGRNDYHLDEEYLVEAARKKHYLVKILEHHKEGSRLSNYHVPGDRLSEFLDTLQNRPGKVLEISSFLPDSMA